VGLKNLVCEDADCIYVAQDTANWMGFLNMVMVDRSGTFTLKLEAVCSSEALVALEQLHAIVDCDNGFVCGWIPHFDPFPQFQFLNLSDISFLNL
jgi:hypothetical protein